MTTTKSWRDGLKVHPAADLFPMMSDDELTVLGKDIVKNGLRQRIRMWSPQTIDEEIEELCSRRKKPKQIFLLDGRNRLEAIERAFEDSEERDGAIAAALREAELVYGDHDPWEYVISANVHRRHLTSAQKADLITALLKAKPDRSDRATSKIAQVDHKTVARKRECLEAYGEIPHVERRSDTYGRSQPANKPPKPTTAHPQHDPLFSLKKAFLALDDRDRTMFRAWMFDVLGSVTTKNRSVH